jgi:hypothetical protein
MSSSSLQGKYIIPGVLAILLSLVIAFLKSPQWGFGWLSVLSVGGLIALIVQYYKKDGYRAALQKSVDEKAQFEKTSEFILVKDDHASWVDVGVLYGLFIMLAAIFYLKTPKSNLSLKSNLSFLETIRAIPATVWEILRAIFAAFVNFISSIKNNKHKLFWLPVIISSIGYLVAVLINKPQVKNNLTKNPNFWIETFFFSFLFIIGDISIKGIDNITGFGLLLNFVVLVASNIFFEFIGFYRWAYSTDENIKKCKKITEKDGSITVDLTQCKSYPDSATNVTFQRKSYENFLLFIGILIMMIIVVPTINVWTGQHESINKDGEKVKSVVDMKILIEATLIGILMVLAISFINYRRNKTFLHYESAVIFLKFFLHHIIWKYTKVFDIIEGHL